MKSNLRMKDYLLRNHDLIFVKVLLHMVLQREMPLQKEAGNFEPVKVQRFMHICPKYIPLLITFCTTG